MSNLPANRAAWMVGKGVKPLQVKEAPYTSAGEGEIVIKNHAIGLNLWDSALQSGMVKTILPWITFPYIFGTDVAGEVFEVGPGATNRFKVGDRVVGVSAGTDKDSGRAAEGAFQNYTVLKAKNSSLLADHVPYENAAVLPLAFSTAASSLFERDQSALDYPTSPRSPPNGKTYLVWGAGSSVGNCAVQLAYAAGYEVLATCSPKSADIVLSLGAARTFDYRSKTVVNDILAALQGKDCAGAVAIGFGSAEPCIDIVGRAPTTLKRKFVTQASGPFDIMDGFPNSITPGLIFTILKFNTSIALRKSMRGVSTKFVFGTDLIRSETGPKIFVDYLGQALAAGEFKLKPEPLVIGKGLEKIQEGIDKAAKGVGSNKVVVLLD